MSDTQIRELERRFKESGSEADEVAWLRERVRVGDLASERLELAAVALHPAARVVAGLPPVEDVFFSGAGFQALERVRDWLEQVFARGPEAYLRASLAALAAVTLEPYQSYRPYPDSSPRPDLGPVYEAAEAWVVLREPEARARLQAVHTDAGVAAGAFYSSGASLGQSVARILRDVAHVSLALPLESWDPTLLRDAPLELAVTCRSVDDDSVSRQIARELADWALGYADAARARVEARRG